MLQLMPFSYQIGLPGQEVKGWYGKQSLKTVNNYTIKCKMKQKWTNFILNEAPNNIVVTYVANLMLNKVPNTNDTTCIENKVRLTAMGAKQFSMVAI